MEHSAADTVIAIGIITAVVGLVDILLSQIQRDLIAKLSLTVWYAVAIFRGRSLSFWLERYVYIKYAFLFALVLIALFGGFAFGNRDVSFERSGIQTVGFLIFILLLSFLLGLIAFHWVVRGRTPLWALARATICLILIPLPLVAVVIYAVQNKENLIPHGSINITQALYVIAYVGAIFSTVVLVIFWTAVAIPVACLYFLIVTLTTLEFVARRVAETSKGPLAAIAVLITVIGAIARLF